MKWIPVKECVLCGQSMAIPYGQGHAPLIYIDDVFGGAPLTVVTNYFTCPDCGLTYQSPRLDDESVIEYYSSGLYRASLGRPAEDLDASERRTAPRIAAYVEANTSHLDIGCSRGYLLAETRKKGCKPFGIEANPAWVTEDVPNTGDLFKISGQWQTITCIHVLEHMTDPVKAARKMIELLAPGGRLIIEVPSDQSPGGPLRLAHLYHFQPWVMRRLFADLILEKFELTPHNLFVFRQP